MNSRTLTTALGMAATLALALQAVGARAEGPKNAPLKHYDVKAFKDIVYENIQHDADLYRHKLDVYMPTVKGTWPVLFFLHGGGWVMGSKDDVFGIFGYGTIARRLAECGLVVVVPNYRLSPGVRHPAHIEDVAHAFAWTWQNVAKYHGNRREIFVCGHSAGGHLAALLVTDPQYLKQVHRSPKDIHATILISGVYRVDDVGLKLALADPYGLVNLKADIQPFSVAFGDDPKAARDASPLMHVHPGLPPCLILSAGWDYPPLKRMAKEFKSALKKNGCPFESKEIPWRTHETMLFDILHQTIEPQARDAIGEFIFSHRRDRKPARKDEG